MLLNSILLLTLCCGARAAAAASNGTSSPGGKCSLPPPQVVFEWAQVEYKWPGGKADRDAHVANGSYIPENCAITGLKVYNGTYFVTVARWKQGVPATLARVVVEDGKPLLDAYPSWEDQRVGEPGALQYVQSMEVDPKGGYMWIIDVGRVGMFDRHQLPPDVPKLVVWDMAHHRAVRVYYFPEQVAPRNASFLNDIVVDTKRHVAYITDAWGEGGLIVYNMTSDSSFRWSSPSMKVQPFTFRIVGVDYGPDLFKTPIDGIALSEDGETLFYCPLHGTSLFAIPTSAIRDLPASDREAHVMSLGDKASPTDGMVFVNDTLIFGGLTTSAVYGFKWEKGRTLTPDNQVVLAQCDETLQWPDTFARDANGTVYVLSNRLDRFFTRKMDFTGAANGANFRVVRVT